LVDYVILVTLQLYYFEVSLEQEFISSSLMDSI